MPEYQTHEHDVLVIGAGGAGLRAAIEAAAAGVSVGLVCKSLLGKAHTVMAEGGIAAALAHVDPQDGWETHFQDTMKGGSFLNHWRMAQIHAQEAPDRVRELEQWGALFDRTADGRILQRAFGGHKWKRLAHVGDRTGLEMIRTLQDKGVHMGIDVRERGRQTAFGHHGVGLAEQGLAHQPDRQTLGRRLDRGPEPRPARANHDHVVFVCLDRFHERSSRERAASRVRA